MLRLRAARPAPTDAATDGSQPRLFTEIRLNSKPWHRVVSH
jgi:hypothetical protein